jgi:hypothetical protein
MFSDLVNRPPPPPPPRGRGNIDQCHLGKKKIGKGEKGRKFEEER